MTRWTEWRLISDEHTKAIYATKRMATLGRRFTSYPDKWRVIKVRVTEIKPKRKKK